ncbi:ComF family protein [Ectobacillus sp. JY-23]|uniref:ComF family protein n=1 Tax=Ectobacillus sp. JY-23 TaxID=2933872 RepID=UPI001FF6DC5F|nr:ComF family protein [Ectobacillus sp. JY-23]UOY91084.1 ComF family protein [Ectobacillus sp. JY-23]
MNCLICFDELQVGDTWFSYLVPRYIKAVCAHCDQKLQRIQGVLCVCCGRMHNTSSSVSENICEDCELWRRLGDPLTCNRSLYVYDDEMKKHMNRFKFRGDVAMAKFFGLELRALFRHSFRHYTPVPVPLSTERLEERGFNQSEILAELLQVPFHTLLARRHTEKQSKKSKRERMNTENPFFLSNEVVCGKKYVLIDDIYTTGVTVRQAASILRKNGAADVAALTLCRG